MTSTLGLADVAGQKIGLSSQNPFGRPGRVAGIVTCGLGGLHAAALHSWGTTITQTRPVRS